MKLSRHQREIIRMICDGWELRNDGLHLGGNTLGTKYTTINSMLEQGVIRKKSGYELTDKGRRAAEDEMV